MTSFIEFLPETAAALTHVPTYEMVLQLGRNFYEMIAWHLASHSILYNVVAFIPVWFIFDAVRNQRKTVAAIAQMSSVQERNEVALRMAEHSGGKAPPEPSSLSSRESRESLASEDRGLLAEATALDRLWYVLGVANVALTPYLLGAVPTWYYVYYTPKVVSLILLRWLMFVKKKQHYLLYDFCYWVNALCLLYCWLYPQNQTLFRVMFINSAGPLAMATLCFNHSLIFHSYAHMTSVVVHVSPMVLVYGLRWHADPHFAVCDDFPKCDSVGHWELVRDAMKYFYLPWSGMYFFWIFVALGTYIEQKNYQTLWDRILSMRMGGPLKSMLSRWPKLLVQALYLLCHLLLCGVAMAFASVLFHYRLAHFCSLVATCGATAYNGGKFYLDALEPLYTKAILERKRGEITTKNLKVLLSASMGLQTAMEVKAGEGKEQ
eukprot:g11570.t1